MAEPEAPRREPVSLAEQYAAQVARSRGAGSRRCRRRKLIRSAVVLGVVLAGLALLAILQWRG